MRKIAADSLLTALHKEVKAGMRGIIAAAEKRTTKKRTTLVNAVGKELQLDGSPSCYGRMCAHVLVGMEQYAVRTICAKTEGLTAIVYDSWLAAPQATGPLLQHLEEQSEADLGFRLSLQLKASPLSNPVPSRVGDPSDF
jgi:hypothetical protein